MSLVFPRVRRAFTRWKRLPQKPSPEWYRQNLETIVRRLKQETTAQIALVSLSQMGEDPDSTNPIQRNLNSLFQVYNGIIKSIAESERVTYLPFYERLQEQIALAPGQAFTSFRFWRFYRDTFRLFVLRRSLDEIGLMNGWHFHTDGLHLNSRAGLILTDLVQGF